MSYVFWYIVSVYISLQVSPKDNLGVLSEGVWELSLCLIYVGVGVVFSKKDAWLISSLKYLNLFMVKLKIINCNMCYFAVMFLKMWLNAYVVFDEFLRC